MARIRSIHPGIWTDSDFMSVSLGAGQLFIGLLNFSDDAGIFEWQEIALKAKIFPTRKIPFKKLLTELLKQGMVEQYEVDGKLYGEIRNFTKWQSPKNPIYKYPENPLKGEGKHCEGSAKGEPRAGEGSAKVVPRESEGKVCAEKDNKNNDLQKKLSTGKDRIGKESNPPNPQPTRSAGEVIPIHTHNHFLNQILSLLMDHTNLSEQDCRERIEQWLAKTGNAQVVIDLVKAGIGKGNPISYISKCVENEEKKRISNPPEQEKSISQFDLFKQQHADDPAFQKLSGEEQYIAFMIFQETKDWMLKYYKDHNSRSWKFYQHINQKKEKVA